MVDFLQFGHGLTAVASKKGEHVKNCPAARTESMTFFLGAAIYHYQRRHNLSDVEIADRLGVNVDQLPYLRLCRAPWANSVTDIDVICEKTGCNPDALRTILREPS